MVGVHINAEKKEFEVREDTEKPKPGVKDVLIKVAAAGVNRPDVLQRRGLYPPPPGHHATIAGLEVSGEVVEVGEEVSEFSRGDSVCALVNGGGYAEYCAVDARQVLPVPKGCSMEEAACIPETYFTVWHNLHQQVNIFGERFLHLHAADNANKTVLIHGGSSGIGTTAVQLCAAFGVGTILSTAGTSEKCATVESLGAGRCFNYRHDSAWTDAVRDATEGRGVDLVLDMVSGEYTQKNLDLLRMHGRLAVIGSLGSPKATINFRNLMRSRLTLGGSTLRARGAATKGDIAQQLLLHVWPLFSQQLLSVVLDSSFPLPHAQLAHAHMESSSHIGKIFLTT